MKGADKAATSISMITDNHLKVLQHQLWIKCHMQLFDENTIMLRSERVFWRYNLAFEILLVQI